MDTCAAKLALVSASLASPLMVRNTARSHPSPGPSHTPTDGAVVHAAVERFEATARNLVVQRAKKKKVQQSIPSVARARREAKRRRETEEPSESDEDKQQPQLKDSNENAKRPKIAKMSPADLRTLKKQLLKTLGDNLTASFAQE